MKKLFLFLVLAGLLAVPATHAADAPAKGKIVHVVTFKFKKAVSDRQKNEVEAAFAALKGKIPQILSLQHGTNISKENFDHGYTHAFVVTFANEKDRDTYLEHDAHKKFGKLLDGLLADKGVFVIDFIAKE